MALSSALSAISRLGLGTAGLAFIGSNCLYDVGPGHKAVVFDKLRNGCQPDARGEGTHFKVPFVQEPHIIDCRARPKVIESQTGTKDVQQVQIVLRVLSRPDTHDESALTKLFQQYGNRKNFDEKVLPSVGNEVLKSVVAQYNAEELLSKREQISRQIYTKLTERAADFKLVLDDVSITHLQFGKECVRAAAPRVSAVFRAHARSRALVMGAMTRRYANAIELKQVAQQEAERQEYIVQKAEQEKVAAITRAEGEAQAAKIISDALQRSGAGLIEVRRIDAAKEIAETLARSRNVTYLPGSSGGGSNMLLGLNAGQ